MSRTSTVRLVCADRVLTMQDNLARVEAVAVLTDRIVAIGTRTGLQEQFPAAQVCEYGDATIVPGFNDAHLHLTMMAYQLLGVDLSADTTPDRHSLTAKLRQASARTQGNGWIRASRYDHSATTEGQVLTRVELDDIVPDHPIVVTHVGAHWGVVNSAALTCAGITDATPDPQGGAYGRDKHGHLNGYLSEQALFDFVYPSLSNRQDLIESFSDDEAIAAIGQASDILLTNGITSVGDAMVGPDELRHLQVARERGILRVRVNALITFPHLDALAAAGIRNGYGDEWIRIGGIKAFADGAVAGRSCAVEQPFEDDSNDRGVLTIHRTFLTELAERATRHGLPLAVHANGERAIEMVLDVLEALPLQNPPLRHRIEHCSIVTPELVRRIAALDVIVVPFTSYPLYHGDKLLGWYGEQRLERMFAHRWFLDAGVTVAASSDFPCGPYEPLLGLQSLMTRTSSSGIPIGLSQRISFDEALSLYATGSAQASGEADLKGRLAPGFLADMTVLRGDVSLTPAAAIGAATILATWVGGEEYWRHNDLKVDV